MDFEKMMKAITSKSAERDRALDEMSKEELEYLLELCQEEVALRQAAKNGGACGDC